MDLKEEFRRIKNSLQKIIITGSILMSYGATQVRNIDLLSTDLKLRYFEAPDLVDMPKNVYRFINAVSDFATHVNPLRRSSSYKENLFAKTMEGNPLVDKAYEILQSG